MLPGRFRHRVSLEKRTKTPGPHGVTETWEPVSTHRARVKLVSVESRARFQQVGQSGVSHRVSLRGYVEMSLANHRLHWLGRGLLLKPVEPPAHVGDRMPFTTIVCKEFVEPHVDDDGDGSGGEPGGPFG